MAVKRPGPYVGLSAHYADDEAIMEAGEDAELLYIRMLAYAARTPLTEGWISDAVLMSRLGILARQSGNGTGNGTGNVPGTDPASRAERLQQVGLIERDGTGWRIVSWLKWNRSAEEMGRVRAGDRKRKGRLTSNDPETAPETCPEPEPEKHQVPRNNDQDQDQDQDHSYAAQLDEAPEPEPAQPEPAAQKRRRGTRIPEDFEATPDMVTWAREHAPHVNGRTETTKFVNYWTAKAGKDATKLDWERTWRNWMLTAEERSPQGRENTPDAQGRRRAWVPPDPPDEVTLDPDPAAYDRWYAAQVEAHRREAS